MRLTSLAPLGLIVLTIAAPMPPASAQYIYDDGTDVAMRRDNGLPAAQRDELFKARRSWKQSSFDRRVGILRSEQRCINRANDADAFRICRQNKNRARQQLRADYLAVINPVRRRVGLPPLEMRRTR